MIRRKSKRPTSVHLCPERPGCTNLLRGVPHRSQCAILCIFVAVQPTCREMCKADPIWAAEGELCREDSAAEKKQPSWSKPSCRQRSLQHLNSTRAGTHTGRRPPRRCHAHFVAQCITGCLWPGCILESPRRAVAAHCSGCAPGGRLSARGGGNGTLVLAAMSGCARVVAAVRLGVSCICRSPQACPVVC
mgnify:CR=1 FL=1